MTIMGDSRANPPVPSGMTCPEDAVERLARARQRAADLNADVVLSEVLDPLSVALEQVLVEHQGMADELISAYEQLGIVFEVTRSLPTVQNEDEVVLLFVESLRRTFAGCTVFSADCTPTGKWSYDHPAAATWDWLLGMLDSAAGRPSVTVKTIESSDSSGLSEILLAPIRAGNFRFGTIVLARSEPTPAFRASDMMIVESLTNFCGDLIRNHRLVHEMREMSIQMVRSLVNAVDQKDEYTSGHSLRVAHYATQLGTALGLRKVDLQMLQWSALLHDVGKIGIRDSVLKKAGRLTDEEFAHIKEHPTRSYTVVKAVPQLADALDGILYHHEHYDGGGYPTGLRGCDIPLQARIVQIADVFDALTSDRSYREAFHWSKALSIMNDEAGRTVDPCLQKTFDRMMRQELEKSPEAWDATVREANRFAQTLEDTTPDQGGE